MQQSQLVGLMLSKLEDLEKKKKKNKHPKNSNKKKPPQNLKQLTVWEQQKFSK